MANGIKAIISDVGNVILDVDKSRIALKLAKFSSLSEAEIRKHFSSLVYTDFDLQFGLGMLTAIEFYEKSREELKLNEIAFVEFCKIYADTLSVRPAVVELLKGFSRKYTVALLSNTDEISCNHWSVMLKDLLAVVRQMTLSFQVHAAKPDPKIYLIAAENLGLKPEECVYIDDIKEYAAAASKLGMKGIQFVSLEQLKNDLKNVGVAP